MAVVRIFINERPSSVVAGATVGDAVRGLDPDLGAAVLEGAAYLTDGVGRRIDPATSVVAGAIIRVVRSARRPDPNEGAR